MQSYNLQGDESVGVIIFSAIDENTESLTFHAEGYSDDSDVSIEPFAFEVTVD